MAADWSSLPIDLLANISCRLFTDDDLLHVHQVCVHWRASTPPVARRPWIITGQSPVNRTHPIGKYSLHAPHGDHRVLDVGAPPAGLPYCCGAPRGWLALMDDDQTPTRLVLWEPVSNAEITLPCMDSFAQIFLSGDPTASPADWAAIAFQQGQDSHQKLRLFLWHPGDGAWTMLHDLLARRVGSVAFHGGKFYCTGTFGEVLTCDLRTRETKKIIVNNAWERLRASSSDEDWYGSMVGSHVVTCNGDLMVVLTNVGCRRPYAEVCKLWWSTAAWCTPGRYMDAGERVTDLGDYSLFLGRGDGFTLSAKEFPAIKKNCIYYVAGEEIELFGGEHWALVFDLELDVVREVRYADELREDGTSWWPYGWFCPRKALLTS